LDNEYLSKVDWNKSLEYINHSDLNQLALLIYTSGSTSSPKGVMLSHMNVMSSISNFDRMGLTEDDVYALFPSFSFVASVFDIYASLAVGASLYIIPKEIRKNVVELKSYYMENNVTITFLPPHMAAKFSKIENDETKLRLMIVGSEMARNLEKKHYRILNVYGASEMTAMISCYDIVDSRKGYPVGTLNPTIRGYIVDADGNQVGPDECGELWLASRQVSMGYYKDENRTSQQFIKNPFTDEEGYERVFKTNDLVQLDEEGNLEYRGRKDYMYKIRGFRVEAGAVETAMLKCGKIKEAVAKAFIDSGGTAILCGYFVADEQIDVKQIKEYLKSKLPYYMVPTALFQMDELPRNFNNKIDRNAILPPKELDDHKLLEKLY
jgi:non-ribosomal peptide synthetase component F